MALLRQISITGFKEIIVSLPEGDQASGNQGQVLEHYYTSLFTGKPVRVNVGSILLDYWGFFAPNSNTRVYPDETKDINNDGIPDYLSLDIDGDGFDDPIGNADFNGVIKKSYLLASFRIKEYGDQNKTIPEMYEAIRAGVDMVYSERILPGWVIIGESKPSFYYEKCFTAYNPKLYSGRMPISKNYFDLDDIFIAENADGTWTTVDETLQVIGRMESPFAAPQGLQAIAARNGFDVNYGLDIEDTTSSLPIKLIQQYMPFVVNGQGVPTFPNINPNRMRFVNYAGTIKTPVSPINLHMATRADILLSSQQLNTADYSTKPFNPDYYAVFPNIPDVIPFSDGAKERWGVPYRAIERGFTINDQKFKGECIPVPNDSEETTLDTGGDFTDPRIDNDERVRVSIADVLGGVVQMDGTNYIRGIVTAHFTYPMMSAPMQDIADVYYEYEKTRKQGTSMPDYSEFWEPRKDLHRSDVLTFAREMRSVIYVQDETAGMELLGTDFYSTDGFEYQTAPGQLHVNSATVERGEDNLPSFESTKTYVTFANIDPNYVGPPLSVEFYDIVGKASPDAPSTELKMQNASMPITEYWETDTGYLPERYHIKVGDFIEIYNMNVIRRVYAPRTCKIVNNEYRVIPNPDLMDGQDVMEYFEKNGYVKEITLDKMKGSDVSNNWADYNYSDLNSIHATEHCLIKVKNVAFITAGVESGPSLIATAYPATVLRNDTMRVFKQQGTEQNRTSIEYDFGYKFEPGKKYAIAQIQEGTTPIGTSGLQKAFVYNAPSTEMSQYLLKIPGRESDYVLEGRLFSTLSQREKRSITAAEQEYLRWVEDNTKKLSATNSLDNYKWPLDIIGIQKFENFFDGTTAASYMIMPRSMYDFGITSQNYTLFFPTGKDVYTVKSGSSESQTGTGARGSGGGSSRTCFYGDTEILTPFGTKLIRDLQVGDSVICFDSDFNMCESSVTTTFVTDKENHQPIYRYKLMNGVELKITKTHPVLVDKQIYVEIGTLSVGDFLIDQNGHKIQISEIEFFGNDIVYNIETNVYHNYIANGICVHNKTNLPPNPIDVVSKAGGKIITVGGQGWFIDTTGVISSDVGGNSTGS